MLDELEVLQIKDQFVHTNYEITQPERPPQEKNNILST